MMPERSSMRKKAETLEDDARLADDFSLSHKLNFVEKPRQLHNPPVEFRFLWCHNGLETRDVDRMTEDSKRESC